ncbi:MAG TPA: hypothetical protein VGB22_01410 [candidate division Zixibacteria bacterium]|jgi:hypothetical protein
MAVIDYSGGAADSTGKFVHIIGPDDEYLVFAPGAFAKYHANIVERFCREHRDLSCTFNAAHDDAALDTIGWRVNGGGRYQLDGRRRTLTLWDASRAYGIFDAARVRALIAETPGWSGYTMRVGLPEDV